MGRIDGGLLIFDLRFLICGWIPGVIRLEGFRRFFDVGLPKTNDDFVLDLNQLAPPKASVNANRK